jgi:hypothetical protein
MFILEPLPVNSAGAVVVKGEPAPKPEERVEVVAASVAPVIPIMLKMYDPRASVVVSVSVSSPDGPEVVSTIVVVYDPLFGEPGVLGAPGGIAVEVDAFGAGFRVGCCRDTVGASGADAVGVGGTGGEDGGAGGADAVGVGGAGGADGGAGCGLLVLAGVISGV